MRRGRQMKLFLIMMLMSLSFCKTLTAGAASVSFSLPVSIELEGDLPVKSETFEIKLVPENPLFPMPENGKDSIFIEDENTSSFSGMKYTHPGIYRYKLYQIKGNSECEYDVSEYLLIVTVTNSAAKELELEISAALYGEKSEGKVQNLIFYNKYPTEPETEKQTEIIDESKPVKTGVDDYRIEYMLLMAISLLVVYGTIRNLYNNRA